MGNHWIKWKEENDKIQEEEELLATWKRLTDNMGCDKIPQSSEREDIENYAQGLLFRNANVIKRHGMLVKQGLKIAVRDPKDVDKLTYYKPEEGIVITRHLKKEI